jgi:hypothetical protein
MTHGLRKLTLTAHVVASLGWLGAVACVLALALVALTSEEMPTVSAAYLGTNVIWRFVILPLSFAALATGVIQAVGTPWGLLRYYWVATKFLLTTGMVMLLLLHTSSLLPGLLAAAADPSSSHASSFHHSGMEPRIHLVVVCVGTLFLLLVNTVLSIYKPWGRTGSDKASFAS